MKQPIISRLRFKINQKKALARKFWFRLLGLKINEGTYLGNITCEWPKNVKIGANCTIQDKVDFRIGEPFSESNYIAIGDRVFIGRHCEFNASTRIIVGNDCKIASNTTFVDSGHGILKSARINEQELIAEDIIVGNDVWIGTNCVILKGVRIGDGCVIAAGAVVNKSIPDYQVWGGVPAKFLKNRD
ncbi:acyltransferase [Pedobacter sp. MC2016-14]|uniref:acyltransferase n=1 Tax=Pedobacter sp. MC2016-14 TaxID=2897327 RepID=UPI001E47E1F0|nr:acyltransferase [Pedobacter sp. MC2016-14]MCD0486866.1 acyltransferase [Pedobacter sp. MC2016-14]